jgi:hypothetical protein
MEAVAGSSMATWSTALARKSAISLMPWKTGERMPVSHSAPQAAAAWSSTTTELALKIGSA